MLRTSTISDPCLAQTKIPPGYSLRQASNVSQFSALVSPAMCGIRGAVQRCVCPRPLRQSRKSLRQRGVGGESSCPTTYSTHLQRAPLEALVVAYKVLPQICGLLYAAILDQFVLC